MENNDKLDMANEPSASYGQQPLNFEKVWLMFQETDKKFKESANDFKEIREMFQKQVKESDKRIKELDQLFTSQWGKLMESLVNGDIINLLKIWGIDVDRTYQRVKGNYKGTSYEFDIIAKNGNEVVIIEVKTTLRTKDVKHFIHKLNKAKEWMHDIKNNKVYGAMAYLVADSSSDTMAVNKGLFVIRATGNSSSIVNNEGFKPVAF